MSETREEFIERYCRESNTSWEELSKVRTVVPCNCDYEGCTGWGMVYHELQAIHEEDNAYREEHGAVKTNKEGG